MALYDIKDRQVEISETDWAELRATISAFLDSKGYRDLPATELVGLSGTDAGASGGPYFYVYHRATAETLDSSAAKTAEEARLLMAQPKEVAGVSLGALYYVCKQFGSNWYWFYCQIINGREVCTNTGIRCK